MVDFGSFPRGETTASTQSDITTMQASRYHLLRPGIRNLSKKFQFLQGQES